MTARLTVRGELKRFEKEKKITTVKVCQNKRKPIGKNEGQIHLKSLPKCDDMSSADCYCPFVRGARKHFKSTRKKGRRRKERERELPTLHQR